jgi:RNA polymerase sigma factor (sigma-70 family)
MVSVRVELTRRQWESIRDPGLTVPEASRWISSEDLEEAIAALTPAHAEALRLFFRGGLSFAEIARRLDIGVGTVGARIHRGRCKLREILRDRLPPAVREQVPARRW